MRICPSNASNINDDVFLIKANRTVAVDVITQNSFDYRPYNAQNFSEGIIYYAQGEPYVMPDSTYHTLDIEWWIICDPAGDSIPEFIIDDDDTTIDGLIIGRIRSPAGCPVPASVPSPTPFYNPKCQYTDRWDQNTSLGVQFDLADLNDGPFGVKSIIWLHGVQFILYFQTCERMTCPPLYSCPEEPDSLSSVWLCNLSGYCTSFGVGVDAVDIRPKNQDVLQGMVLTMTNPFNQKSAELWLTCRNDFPDGHIDWSPNGIVDNGRLLVNGSTTAVCLREIVPPGSQACNFSASAGPLEISIDLEHLNVPSGWRSSVDVQGVLGYPHSWLYYEPCGSLVCPPHMYCQGVEDAAIWLCRNESNISLCTAYGLWGNPLTLSLYSQFSLDSGVKASYVGDLRSTADVQFVCNRSLGFNEILMPSYVTLTHEAMQLIVQSRQACAMPDPTPRPQSLSPTPTHSYTGSPPSSPDFVPHKASGGAIFLLILLVGGLLYFSGGIVISMIHTGIPSVPHARMWRTLMNLICLSVRWIINCGKIDRPYENIPTDRSEDARYA
jgi:hypothetical protein